MLVFIICLILGVTYCLWIESLYKDLERTNDRYYYMEKRLKDGTAYVTYDGNGIYTVHYLDEKA